MFTEAYWAQRVLHLVQHIDQSNCAGPTAADQQHLLNPDQLRGIPGARTVETSAHPHAADAEADSDNETFSEQDDCDLFAHHPEDEYWIATLVLLSRVGSFDDLLILRMPDPAALSRPRPEFLRKAYAAFQQRQATTLQELDKHLHSLNLESLRQRVTSPLLSTPSTSHPRISRKRRASAS
eukprot:Skav219305  [mRNA]  locus=scaffold2489:11936:14720:- [translate_table: standard]